MVDPFENLQLADEFRQQRLIKKNGEPVGEKTFKAYADRGEIPVISIGGVAFVDLKALAARLNKSQEPSPRRRGRPRIEINP